MWTKKNEDTARGAGGNKARTKRTGLALGRGRFNGIGEAVQQMAAKPAVSLHQISLFSLMSINRGPRSLTNLMHIMSHKVLLIGT